MKDLGRWSSGGTPPRDREELWEGELPWISAKDFHNDELREPTTFITERAGERYSRIAPAGSILVIVRGMALVHGLPVAQTRGRVAFNQDLRGLRPSQKFDCRFVYYALRGTRTQLNAHIDRAAHGTARVNESVMSERLVMPSRDEQTQVSHFLDREGARIGSLSEHLDHHLVIGSELERRVLDDTLGHIATTKLGWRAAVQTGLTLGTPHESGALVSRPYLRVANVQASNIDVDDLAIVEVPQAVAARTSLRAGDVLMTEGGDIDKLGRGAVWDGRVDPCLHQNHIFAVRCGPSLEPQFLALWTRSTMARDYFERTASRITNIASTNLTKVLALPVPDLTVEDQRARISSVEASGRRIAALRGQTTQLRATLAKYRDALITEAVTGKLDVTRLSEPQMDESAHAAMEGERPEVLSA